MSTEKPKRLAPTIETIRHLFALSGNQCAFPDCYHELVMKEDTFVAEVCHLRAALPGGERFDSSQTNEERRELSNLLVLCHKHHKITNNVDLFPIETMVDMKRTHESKFSQPFRITSEKLYAEIEADSARFSTYLTAAQQMSTVPDDILVEINPSAKWQELLLIARSCISGLQNLHNEVTQEAEQLPRSLLDFVERCGLETVRITTAPYHEHPFEQWLFENLNMGLPNWLQSLSLAIDQLELRLFEMEHQHSPKNVGLREELERKRVKLSKRAEGECIVD